MLLFCPQFPSYLKDYLGGFTLPSFWASPAEWEEASRHAPCLVILFLLQAQAKSQSITDSEPQGADRQPRARAPCKELTQTESERSSTAPQIGDLEQVSSWALTFFFFSFVKWR